MGYALLIRNIELQTDIPPKFHNICDFGADVIVCRAGALTGTEGATVGLPAVVVPFPHAVDDHQTANAKTLSEHGAAFLMPQKELTAESLSAILAKLDRHQILAMAEKAREFAKPNATQLAADAILSQLKP